MNPTLESSLLSDIRQNNQTAMDALILGHHGMVYKLAGRHGRDEDHKEDLVSIGNLALCKAARTFPLVDRECRFSTYVQARIEASFIHSMRIAKGSLSASEWEGRTDARKKRQWKQLAQDLGREPTLDEFSFVYEESMCDDSVADEPIEAIDREYSVSPVNGKYVDHKLMPKTMRMTVEWVGSGATFGECADQFKVSRGVIESLAISAAANYIHFTE